MRCLQKLICLLVISALFSASSFAQSVSTRESQDEAYMKVVTQRADKIVATLGIPDSSKYKQVREMIASQYFHLNEIQTAHDKQVKEIKSTAASDKAAADSKLKAVEDETSIQLTALHKKYIAALQSGLSEEQVAKVKDGMTYGVLPITYKGYLAMLPDLTGKQKDQIMAWLTEARELAIDGGSSEAKHAWFGKYKGRINNYLSAQGYNMKQASEDWAKRVKEEEAAKGKQ